MVLTELYISVITSWSKRKKGKGTYQTKTVLHTYHVWEEWEEKCEPYVTDVSHARLRGTYIVLSSAAYETM